MSRSSLESLAFVAIECCCSRREQDKLQAKEENDEYAMRMHFLSQVHLLKRLPKDQHPLLAAALVLVEFHAKQTIIKQGDAGSEFFVIKSGEASVSVSRGDGPPVKVATLGRGDYFGERALLRDEPRTATITADSALAAFKITREKFRELGLNERLQFASRKAVVGGIRRVVDAKPPTPKTHQERALISEALRQNQTLQTMVALDDQRVNQMVDVAWKEDISVGQEIIKEGDLAADYFYIVQEGSFEVLINEQEGTAGESKNITTVSKGGSFGELALLYLAPRAASVKAVSTSVVWVIDRTNFKAILMRVSEEKIKEYIKHLDRVDVLSPLLAQDKQAMAQALVEITFTKDEAILRQGDPGSTFYVLYEGEVAIIKDGKEIGQLKASSQEGAKVFGEKALLNSELRAATVRVVSETAKALALDRASFELLLGPLAEIVQRGSTATRAARSQRPQDPADSGCEKILRKDLVRIGPLGCGTFGAVELWQHHQHQELGNTYALKSLSKGSIVKACMQESVCNEKNVLMMTNSPFIIKLYATYDDAQTLYFLLEPALGGELFTTYNRKGFHGSERHAKFYVAGVVFALEHCHERHIIYRDLKPENVLVNDGGHLKVTDMGLAKFVIGKTYTTCGTPDYMAPEIIASTGHTNAVDWWSLGILLFELMAGHPPFESAHPVQVYSQVNKGIGAVPFPAKCQGHLEGLIKGLLAKEPSERLPMRPSGTTNLKESKWYAGFDWASMANLTMDPPYKPLVKTRTDIANFSAREEDMPGHVDYEDDGSGWDKDFATD